MTPIKAPGDLFGHPRGLSVLFATETWERFSYFGNSALVVLYMVQHLLQPGRIEGVIGFAAVRSVLEAMFGPLAPQPLASQLFGFYTGLAYSAPVIGGLVADRILGERRTVVIGGLLMAAGHFMMAFEALFLPALAFLILGVGAFKPNIDAGRRALSARRSAALARKSRFFLMIAAVAALAGVALWALSSVVRSAFVTQPSEG